MGGYFVFTVRSGQSIFIYLDEHPLTFRFPIEVLSGILGVLPSSFRPSSIEKLEIINTRYWILGASEKYYGGKPPDLLVTGIYTFNLIGVIVLPLLLGKIFQVVDHKYNNVTGYFDREILFALCLYPTMRIIAYTNFDGIALNFFYIVLGYIILWIISHVIKDTTNLE